MYLLKNLASLEKAIKFKNKFLHRLHIILSSPHGFGHLALAALVLLQA